MESENEALGYPIGRYQRPKKCTPELQHKWIAAIEALPRWLTRCTEYFSEKEQQIPYTEGWTVQQLVHHIADVHMNVYITFKRALTEDNPTINPYDENLWAELPDIEIVPASFSISLLQGLHRRWAEILLNMKSADWGRTYHHLGQSENTPLWEMVSFHAWHGAHYIAQITHLYLREQKKLHLGNVIDKHK